MTQSTLLPLLLIAYQLFPLGNTIIRQIYKIIDMFTFASLGQVSNAVQSFGAIDSGHMRKEIFQISFFFL